MRFNVIEAGDIVMTDLALFGVVKIAGAGSSHADVEITEASMHLYRDQCEARGLSPAILQRSHWPREKLIIVQKWNDPIMQGAEK